MRPTCSNECAMFGWIECEISNGIMDMHISHAPDTDLDDRFLAFDHDMQECVRVNGWQIEDYYILATPSPIRDWSVAY